MKSLLNSTQNTRPILPDSLRYIRSDVPGCLTEQEVQWFLDNNIITIIDLREDTERERKKCHLIDDQRFQYFCMPVTGGNAIPKSVEDVSKSYIKMVDEHMDEIIDTIMNAGTNVLFFCNAGKDRTGVVSAMILHKLGMDKDYIIKDYMESKENLKDMLEEYANAFPEVDIGVITPQERYMEEFLDWLSE
ncbi:MAG: tyrosine-protein phosphatase [Lachnospiraceae bacterium]|nr:tyrosine-protein phosphatase [Lachnospiraceae bacterium]